jgi:uncharacterized protein YfaQ (DUF2300 family)
MKGKLKLSGLILISVLAMSAAAATAAQASEFTASEYPAEITGEQLIPYTFSIGPNKIVCEATKITISQATPLSLVTEQPTFSKCTVGARPATVTLNGCDFLASVNGTRSISCPAGKVIQVHIYANAAAHAAKEDQCEINVAAQEGLGTTTYENKAGSPEDIKATDNISGIAYTIVKGTKLLCGSNGTATLSGEMTLKAKNSGGVAIGYMIG